MLFAALSSRAPLARPSSVPLFFGLTVDFIKKPRCERRESKLWCDLDGHLLTTAWLKEPPGATGEIRSG